MWGRGGQCKCVDFFFNPKLSLIIFEDNTQQQGACDSVRALPAPLSPGSRFIFFSWILCKLDINPRSEDSFRYLTVKFLGLGLALFFSSIFFLPFAFILSSFHKTVCPSALTYTHTHTHSLAHTPFPQHSLLYLPMLFVFLIQERAYSAFTIYES